ncbi:hypothetical protein HWV62_40836 [Athelia sp. TMB]|nr:hypothetical protein HWV62_40836 [Athelia sp. TMB]
MTHLVAREQLFVSGAYDGVVRLWDVRSVKGAVASFHTGEGEGGKGGKVLSVDWQGCVVAVGGEGGLEVWRVGEGGDLCRLSPLAGPFGHSRLSMAVLSAKFGRSYAANRGSTPATRGSVPTNRGSTPAQRGSTSTTRGSTSANRAKTPISRASTPTHLAPTPTRNNTDDAIALLTLASKIPPDAFPALKGVASKALCIVDAVKKFKSSRQEWTSLGQFVQTAATDFIRLLGDRDIPEIPEAKQKLQDLFQVLEKVQIDIEATQNGYPPGRIRPVSKDRQLVADMKIQVDSVSTPFGPQRAAVKSNETISSKELLSRIMQRYGDVAHSQLSSTNNSPTPGNQEPPPHEHVNRSTNWIPTPGNQEPSPHENVDHSTDSTPTPDNQDPLAHENLNRSTIYAPVNFTSIHNAHVLNVRGNSTNKIREGNVVMHVNVDATTNILRLPHLLKYAEGASWNPTLACLLGTRVKILTEIDVWSWALDDRIVLWLKDVAGSGKSAIAHTIAKMLHDQGRLASCFFFRRDVASLSNAQLLVINIARDIASCDDAIAEDIRRILESNPALASAHISRQFAELIAGPLCRRGRQSPFIVVIDALDESMSIDEDTSLLDILSKDVLKVAGHLRIMVTSRPTKFITQFLAGLEHIKPLEIKINSDENKTDIAQYIKTKFLSPNVRKIMGPAWPDEPVIYTLEKRSDGLFIWIVTLYKYLSSDKTYQPRKKLDDLLSKSARPLKPEEQMDDLYADILETNGNWEDPAFVEDYQTALGAVMAAKHPLSLAALRALHSSSSFTGGVFAEGLLERLGSVLVGFDRPDEPIHIIHESFREFVAGRAKDAEHTRKFHISEKEHSANLAELCLQIMVREFAAAPIPGTGYLAEEADDLSVIPEVTNVSEQLLYGCESLTDHIADVEIATATLTAEMQKFVSHHSQVWMEIVPSVSIFRGSLALMHWLETHAPTLRGLCDDEAQAIWLSRLSHRLGNIGRVGEALTAIQEALVLFRPLAAEHPTAFNGSLARSLVNKSKYLSDLGRTEEALAAVQEGLVLLRPLAAEQPAAFNGQLTSSLMNESKYLSDLGRTEEALAAVQEGLVLLRPLAAEHPAVFIEHPGNAFRDRMMYLLGADRKRETNIIQTVVGDFSAERDILKNEERMDAVLSQFHAEYEAEELRRKNVAAEQAQERLALLPTASIDVEARSTGLDAQGPYEASQTEVGSAPQKTPSPRSFQIDLHPIGDRVLSGENYMHSVPEVPPTPITYWIDLFPADCRGSIPEAAPEPAALFLGLHLEQDLTPTQEMEDFSQAPIGPMTVTTHF